VQSVFAADAFWLPGAPTVADEETQIFTALQQWVRTGTLLPVGSTAAMETNAFIWLRNTHPALARLLLLLLFLPDRNLLDSFQTKLRMQFLPCGAMNDGNYLTVQL